MKKTVLIYSYYGLGPSVITLEMALLSNHLAQKQKFKTVLYIDKKNKELFSHIPYSEVIEFDDKILKKFPPIVWSAGKLLAASLETRPFLHVDFDFLILNDAFYKIIKNKDFVNYHFEPWWNVGSKKNQKFTNKALKYFLKNTNGIFKIDYTKDLGSYNFAIFGSCKQKNIKIINEECRSMVKSIIKAKDILQNKRFINYIAKNSFGNSAVTVIVEQVITMAKIKDKLKSFHSILKIKEIEESYQEGLKFGLLHLWASKNMKSIQKELTNTIEKILKLSKI